MNPLPKKQNVLLTLKEEKPIVSEEEMKQVDNNTTRELEEVEETPEPEKKLSNEDLFENKLETPSNVIEVDIDEEPSGKKKKKKRQLSQKQLDHLARMRQRALEKRKKIREQKLAEKEKKRLAKEQKRLEKERKKEEKQRKTKESNRDIKPVQPNVSEETRSRKQHNQQFSGNMDFNRFYNYMERYERIKSVRSRQTNRPTNTNKNINNPSQNNKPKNKYLGTLIPF